MRERKKINYAAFDNGGDEDDDFTDATPPNKKITNKENKPKVKKNEPVVKVGRKRTERESPSDREYRQDLETALNQSISESSDFVDDNNPSSVSVVVEPMPCHKDDSVPADEVGPVKISDVASAIASKRIPDIDNTIEVLEEDITPPAKRPRVSSKAQLDDSESDESNFSEEDATEDEDSDFNDDEEDKVTKKKTVPDKPTKKLAVTKVSKSASKVGSSITPAAQRTSISTTPLPAPTLPSPRGSSRSSTTMWTPPGGSNKSAACDTRMTSPNSGMRLGLSRNQRVKPLHPSVRIQT